MSQTGMSQKIELTIPAEQAYASVVCLTLSGFGMVLGLDVDLLGDLRTVAAECLDCLLHQAGKPASIEVCACAQNNRLSVRFTAKEREKTVDQDELALEITRGVLETLMPEVQLDMDEDGVHGIACSMPV